MPPRNRHLFLCRVAVEPDHFHAIDQRRGNRVGEVGCRHEEHLREIELHVEVVIAKRVVLSRVEYFEEGC